jgi:hypothetical protein
MNRQFSYTEEEEVELAKFTMLNVLLNIASFIPVFLSLSSPVVTLWQFLYLLAAYVLPVAAVFATIRGYAKKECEIRDRRKTRGPK